MQYNKKGNGLCQRNIFEETSTSPKQEKMMEWSNGGPRALEKSDVPQFAQITQVYLLESVEVSTHKLDQCCRMHLSKTGQSKSYSIATIKAPESTAVSFSISILAQFLYLPPHPTIPNSL